MRLSRTGQLFSARPPSNPPTAPRRSPVQPPGRQHRKECSIHVLQNFLHLVAQSSRSYRPRNRTRLMTEFQPSQAPAPQRQTRGGRRRGRGGARQGEHLDAPDGAPRGPRSRGNGPRRGGGRGGRGGQNRDIGKPDTEGDVDGPSSAETTTTADKGKARQETADDADDGEICFICASKVEHNSVSPCNHRTCHICALRLRALYKNKACAHCRVCSVIAVLSECTANPFVL